MKNIKISNKFIFIMYMRIIAIFLFLVVIFAAFFMFYKAFFNILVSFLAFLGIVLLFYIPFFYKSFEIYYDKEKININYGVFFRFKVNFHIKNVQYFSFISSPFQRIFKLSSIIASFSGGIAVIPCINLVDMETLNEILKGDTI